MTISMYPEGRLLFLADSYFKPVSSLSSFKDLSLDSKYQIDVWLQPFFNENMIFFSIRRQAEVLDEFHADD